MLLSSRIRAARRAIGKLCAGRVINDLQRIARAQMSAEARQRRQYGPLRRARNLQPVRARTLRTRVCPVCWVGAEFQRADSPSLGETNWYGIAVWQKSAESADKPGSVVDDHSSGRAVTDAL